MSKFLTIDLYIAQTSAAYAPAAIQEQTKTIAHRAGCFARGTFLLPAPPAGRMRSHTILAHAVGPPIPFPPQRISRRVWQGEVVMRYSEEALEPRCLLAGLTLITHGFNSGTDAWVSTMAAAMARRLGGAESVSIYTLSLANPSAPFVDYVNLDQGPFPYTAQHNGEIIYKIDWSAMDANDGVSTATVASVVANYFINTQLSGHGRFETPLQLIGHSRGGSLISELARRFGERGIWVDQFTPLDPHPWSLANDPPVRVYDNVAFADNYYQTSAAFPIPHGAPVSGALNKGPLLLGGAHNPLTEFGQHADVHLFYHGTVDTAATAHDGTHAVPSAWYTGSQGPRGALGFYYSRRNGGIRPADGRGPILGGSAHRQGIVQSGTRWPNVADIGVSGGASSFPIGATIPVTYRYQDADTSALIEWFFDSDKNPYNGTIGLLAPSQSVSATGNAVVARTVTGSTSGRQPGTYYIGSKVSDTHGHLRYHYAPNSLQLTNPTHGSHFASVNDSDMIWSDPPSLRNDGDGVIEAGESPSLRLRLRNSTGNAIQNIDATLSTTDPDIVITDADVYFNNILGGGSGWSVGAFDMDLNFSNQRTSEFIVHVEYQVGGQSYYQNIPVTKFFYPPGTNPAFSVVSHRINDSASVASQNDNDGIFESGERVDVIPMLRNNGVGPVTRLDAWLTSTNPDVQFVPSDVERYPDMGPAQQAEPNNGKGFRVLAPNKNFAGNALADVHLVSAQSPNGIVIPSGLQVAVAPAPWLGMSRNAHDFGATPPGQNPFPFYDLVVSNAGSAPMQVSDVMREQPADTTTDFTLPFILNPGQSRTIRITINTTGLNGNISRAVRVISTGRLDHPDDNRLVITGLVSSAVPIYPVPDVVGPEAPDISGNWIVWGDSREGNLDVYAYNIATDVHRRITTNPAGQSTPRISGNIVAWNDSRNSSPTPPFNTDIYGYDLVTGQEFVISNHPADEKIIGVDGSKVSFRREAFAFAVGGGTDRGFNVHVHDLNTSQATQITNYTAPVPGSPAIYASRFTNDADQDQHNVTWIEVRREWVSSSMGWGSGQQTTLKMHTLGGSTQTVVTGDLRYHSLAEGRVAYVKESATGIDQIWLWENGAVAPVTNSDRDIEAIALGASFVIYDKDGVGNLFYWDLRPGGGEALLTNNLNSINDLAGVRMDGNGFVLASGSLYYGFIQHPDIGVASADVNVSNPNPLEGQTITVSALVRNLTEFPRTSDITVKLFDGNPDAGGVERAADTIAGGLAAGAQRLVTFANVPVGLEGQHTLYVRLCMSGFDNPSNNTASKPIQVLDSDTTGPTISQIVIAEHNGDGDGIIGSDEEIRIGWSLADPSGIGPVTLLVDGIARPFSQNGGNYFATLPPLPTGQHPYLITATDGDHSPAISSADGTFDVVAPEEITVLYNGQPITLGGTVQLGALAQGSTVAPIVFGVRNDGDQALTLGPLTAPLGFTTTGPFVTVLPDGGFTYFTLTPDTANIGSLDGLAWLVNGDLDENPFQFTVLANVVAPPQLVASSFQVDLPRQAIVLQFSHDVGASLSLDDLNLFSETSNTAVPTSSMNLSWSSTTFTAMVTFPSLPFGVLQDGDYLLTIPAAAVQNALGHTLLADVVFDFFFLNGDANRDRRVNLQDFNRLAANFGQSNRTFSQGDFNYDTIVNLADFNILASRFGTVVAPDGTLTRVDGERLPSRFGGAGPFGTGLIGGGFNDETEDDEQLVA